MTNGSGAPAAIRAGRGREAVGQSTGSLITSCTLAAGVVPTIIVSANLCGSAMYVTERGGGNTAIWSDK